VSLSIFDKINLAHCAIQRAESNFKDTARFTGEYDSVLCWYNHRVAFLATPSGFLNYSYW
jgi:hypothetical protein